VKPDDGAIVAIAGERGAVWLGVVSRTTCVCIFLDWLDEAMDGSYHLTADPPTSVSYNSLMCADVSLDLNNQMRPVLWSWLLSMQKDWPDLDEDSSHLSPTCTKELPDHEPLRRGKRRK
jgi:hypothetical protein